jgi:hypothetical protein
MQVARPVVASAAAAWQARFLLQFCRRLTGDASLSSAAQH